VGTAVSCPPVFCRAGRAEQGRQADAPVVAPFIPGVRAMQGESERPVIRLEIFSTKFEVDVPDPGGDSDAKGKMSGFVDSYRERYPYSNPEAIMFFINGTKVLPTYHFLAKYFMVCDRWFSSHPGPRCCRRAEVYCQNL